MRIPFLRCAAQLLTALILALPLTPPDAARAAELIKLTVGAMPITGQAKFFVAKERGIFLEEGLDVELAIFTSGADGIAAFRAEKLDAGAFGTATPLAHISRGEDALIIAGIMGQDSMYITTPERADSVRSVKDLKGKKIAVVRLASGDVVLRWALQQNGLDLKKDVEFIELKNPTAVIEAVKKGQADVGALWGPYDQGAEEKGFKVVLDSADLLPGHPCCRLIVRTGELNSRGDVWVRLLRSLLKAEFYSRSGDPAHRENTVNDIAKYVKLDKELIRNAFYGARLDQSTDPNASGLQKIWDIMNFIKVIDSKDDIQRFIEPGPYKTALESLIRESPDEPFWREALAVLNERDTVAKGGGRSDIHWEYK
ncbi:MAG: ABC transporter substrate-binding protein [Deltaproteobacteria bacterium]|jgi:NitT/TauT family transport system substrate-binding protein|nr:ABC transporter substrate-binding protein [Deltaproteobacteria bacterium]